MGSIGTLTRTCRPVMPDWNMWPDIRPEKKTVDPRRPEKTGDPRRPEKKTGDPGPKAPM